MHANLTPFDLEANRRSLSLELHDADDRQLLDIGLVRGEDGSLRLAEDPARLATPDVPRAGFLERLSGLFHWVRRLPLRSPDWHPHFFLRE